MQFRQNKNQSKHKFISYFWHFLWLLGWPGIRRSCGADVAAERENALNAVFSKRTAHF
jgi:hypothetical protein